GSYLGAQGAVQAVAQTALQGGSLGDNLQTALTGQVYHLVQAVAFNAAGDFADGKWADIDWKDGSAEKIALHAVVGGLLSEATGSDFATGALAAGANEALVEQFSGLIKGDKNLELAVSQLIGVAAATATGGDPAKAAELAKNATAYNRQLHPDEKALAKRLAEQSDGKFTVEQMEDALRRSSIPGEDIYANSDMVVTADGIYDTGGQWIFGGDGQSFIQLLPEANVSAIQYVAENTSGYAWDNRSLGIQLDPQQMQYPLEFPGCIACAAGFSYSLNTLDMRTPAQMEVDQRAFTLGVSSFVGLPIAGGSLLATYGVRPILAGAGLGSGFDAVGQVVDGGEYRPGNTVVAGVTGGLAYPLAGGALVNTLLGGAVGGTNAAGNNYLYFEDKSISDAAFIGAFAGLVGGYVGTSVSSFSSKLLPYRIGGSMVDPNKPILLQNIGVLNPYPDYIGEAAGGAVSGGIPILFEKIQKDN
ncbi:DUF637 domain-containing protein, partial [Pseudomonas lopnurensis]|uniref:DUF637 domain-containing protein n=1 Tax=Pseudomonas lopnurensis TaxID=1477517 RepID=UPI0028B1A7A6